MNDVDWVLIILGGYAVILAVMLYAGRRARQFRDRRDAGARERDADQSSGE